MPPEGMSGQVRNRLGPVNSSMKVINPRGEGFEEIKDDFATRHRQKYSAMRAHQEMAAQALAVGATQRMAATYAGISVRQIKKYFTDPDFRARIEELRVLLASKVRGRILRELGRRTTTTQIKQMELLDMLRIWDRIGGGAGAKSSVNIGEVNVSNNYDTILAALFAPNTGPEGTDFQGYGPEDLLLPGGDSSE